jgi:hypothetical protein
VCGLDSSGSGSVASSCECGDEPSGSCATELVTDIQVRRWSQRIRVYSRSGK